MKKLRENGYISMEKAGLISLTDKGYPIARRIYDRHLTLTRFFVSIGVDEATARKDACKVEHDISEVTFSMIRKQLENH
jgi:Mn-dependent DtxR family transcriptional regulator